MSWNKACKYFKDAQEEFERERLANCPDPEPDAETDARELIPGGYTILALVEKSRLKTNGEAKRGIMINYLVLGGLAAALIYMGFWKGDKSARDIVELFLFGGGLLLFGVLIAKFFQWWVGRGK